MDAAFDDRLSGELQTLRSQGLYKTEREIGSAQGAVVTVGDRRVINLCANNYLGLAGDPQVVAAAHAALDAHGYGMASVRFICGTNTIHRRLEHRLAGFLGMADAILYSSCFDANGGLFETVTNEDDAIISDALNHASIIDGIRLSKAQRLRYANRDMTELEARLVDAKDARTRLIVTDGVFSMDGTIAPLGAICDLADRHNALVVVDDSHATGFVGAKGRGTPEACGVEGRVDVLTGTLGKALGGAAGGYVAGSARLVEWLRQRSRPYLFSNSIPPAIAATTLAVIDRVAGSDALREKLAANAAYFRRAMTSAGFRLTDGSHPIVPVMIGDAALAARMADRILELGVYVVGFSFPVVPKGAARIRTQMSAAHSIADLDRAVLAFTVAGRELGLVD